MRLSDTIAYTHLGLDLIPLITVKVKRSFPKQSVKSKHFIHVLPVFNIALAERGRAPIEVSHTEQFRLTGVGHTTARAWLPRSAYLLGEDIGVHLQVENSSNKSVYGFSMGLREELVAEGGESGVQSRRATLYHVTHDIDAEAIPEHGNFVTFIRLPAQRWYRRSGVVRPTMAVSAESSLSRQHTLSIHLKIGRARFSREQSRVNNLIVQ